MLATEVCYACQTLASCHSQFSQVSFSAEDFLRLLIAFIYLAYPMMALRIETDPAFEETWIECPGDLNRYRMAIGGDNCNDGQSQYSVRLKLTTTLVWSDGLISPLFFATRS